MTIQVTSELDFNDLMVQCWSGAVDTLNRIYDNNMEDAFMDLLNDSLETPTLTEVNDYLWFEADEIFEYLGISEDEDDEDDYDEDDEDYDEDYDEDDEDYDEDDEDDEMEMTKMIMTKMTKMKMTNRSV